MQNMGNYVRNTALALAFSVALSACVVVPARGYYVGSAVAVEPPPVRIETYGAAPYPGYIWAGGYWNWVGGRHEWVPGHWEAPRRGYRWEPHHWVRERDGWHMHGGHWVR